MGNWIPTIVLLAPSLARLAWAVMLIAMTVQNAWAGDWANLVVCLVSLCLTVIAASRRI